VDNNTVYQQPDPLPPLAIPSELITHSSDWKLYHYSFPRWRVGTPCAPHQRCWTVHRLNEIRKSELNNELLLVPTHQRGNVGSRPKKFYFSFVRSHAGA
jgi:hypothetical protein